MDKIEKKMFEIKNDRDKTKTVVLNSIFNFWAPHKDHNIVNELLVHFRSAFNIETELKNEK